MPSSDITSWVMRVKYPAYSFTIKIPAEVSDGRLGELLNKYSPGLVKELRSDPMVVVGEVKPFKYLFIVSRVALSDRNTALSLPIREFKFVLLDSFTFFI